MLHILIATRGRPTLLERTLQSIQECEPVPVFGGTLVVENGERSGAEDVVGRAAAPLQAKYLFHPEANKSTALNAALHELQDGLVVFLDDDVRVSPGLLRAYAAATSGMTQGVFLGGPVHPEYEVQPPSWLVPYLPPSARGWSRDPTTSVITSSSFIGVNWAAFVRDLKQVGGFDPWFGPGSATGSTGQETTMQRRLLAAGLHGRYVSEAQVWHWIPQDRCSRQWALHRAFREGIRHGLEAQLPADTVRVWGYPRYAVRSAAEQTVRAIVRSVDPRREARFKARREWLVALGFLKGNRLAHVRNRSS